MERREWLERLEELCLSGTVVRGGMLEEEEEAKQSELLMPLDYGQVDLEAFFNKLSEIKGMKIDFTVIYRMLRVICDSPREHWALRKEELTSLEKAITDSEEIMRMLECNEMSIYNYMSDLGKDFGSLGVSVKNLPEIVLNEKDFLDGYFGGLTDQFSTEQIANNLREGNPYLRAMIKRMELVYEAQTKEQLKEASSNLCELVDGEHTAEEIGEGIIKDLTHDGLRDALNVITDIDEPQKDPHTIE